jgi:predicted transposase YdaD
MCGGKNLATVDDMITELIVRNRQDLLGLAKFCAGLVFTDEANQHQIEERFDKVQDIIETSWVYQGTLQKGREEGRQQGIQTAQRMAVNIVAARFPELELLARAIITTICDLQRLEVLVVELSTSSSQEDTKQLLLSLVSTA